MSVHDDDIPGELASLIAAERVEPEVPGEVRARMSARLDTALGLAGTAAAAGAAHAAREALSHTLATSGTTAGASAAGSVSGSVSGGALGAIGRVLAMKLPFGVLMFSLGGVSGGVVVAKLRPAPSAVVAPSVRAHVPVAVARPMTPPREEPAAPSVVVEPPVVPPSVVPQVPPVTPDSSVGARVANRPPVVVRPTTEPQAGAEEAARRVLERARVAIRENHPRDAREALSELESRYPSEEVEARECLWVQLLVREGQREAALARAARFHQRFPGSFFTATVDESVAGLR